MKFTEMIKLGIKGFKPSDIKQINEAGIQTEDIIKLAENGYSMTDVNELITLAGTQETVQPGNSEENNQAGLLEVSQETKVNAGEDIAELLKQKDQQLEEMKKTLEKIQNQNSQKQLAEVQQKDPQEELKNIFRSIY